MKHLGPLGWINVGLGIVLAGILISALLRSSPAPAVDPVVTSAPVVVQPSPSRQSRRARVAAEKQQQGNWDRDRTGLKQLVGPDGQPFKD